MSTFFGPKSDQKSKKVGTQKVLVASEFFISLLKSFFFHVSLKS